MEDEAAAARVLMDEVGAAAGFVVAGHTCSGGTALRRVVSDDEVDLVMLDIQLPDISGMDVLRRLRAAGCDVDVMAVTVLRDPSMLQAAMALGVVHYLLKPFTAATVRRSWSSTAPSTRDVSRSPATRSSSTRSTTCSPH